MVNNRAHSSLEQSFLIDQPFVIRAALDLGSATFKLSIAEVNKEHVQLKFSKVIKVGLGVDLAESQGGTFSEKVQSIALHALRELTQEAAEKGATQFAGIATAAFRQALNGDEFLQQLKKETGIDLHLISQEEEGALAFKAFVNAFPGINERNCIALDLGAASFQLTAKNLDSYDVLSGPLGASKILKMFSEEVQNIPYQRGLVFTSITLDQIQVLIEKIKSKVSSAPWLEAKLLDKTVEVLYLDDWIDEIQQRTGQEEVVSQSQIWEALIKMIELTNADLDPKGQIYIMSYALLYSVMVKLQIRELRMKLHNTGSTLGMMTEERFWPQCF